MEEDLNSLLEKLKFSKEETTKIVSTNLDYNNTQGFEAWAIGKLWSIEKVNREAMYQVFKSIWYTKEEANFVAMKGVSFVMFENVEDRKRILNLSPGCLTSASSLCFLMLKKQRWIHMLSTYLHFGQQPAISPAKSMKFLCWNYYGLGNPTIVREFKQFLVVNNPDVIFLNETKMKANDFQHVQNRCMMKNGLAMSSEGRSGDLALMWREDFDVNIQNCSKFHIDALVQYENNRSVCFTGFYGDANPSFRNNS
ncbi:hypothetical protein ES288_A09G090400v1 [Gossypium darwinii]|uniref:Endonuclease/exonuclease/phosphatase domain-containing protein n=1 Tax=Gossypium darwinii TaxID=34276 RepID=A0A5D2F6Z7_GOSDA|nr:hypothetical protein ES288_A09G090400v1 [Gossypium darwinii]